MSNLDYMITTHEHERITGWFTGRLPEAWRVQAPHVTVDRDEITVIVTIPDVDELAGDAAEEARLGRISAFREETRDARIKIATQAQDRYQRKVSWGVRVGDQSSLFTHVSAPVMTRLRQPQRQVLDTLVAAGVARSRADALAWCVRLVGQHEGDWLAELRDAMESVSRVREQGPDA